VSINKDINVFIICYKVNIIHYYDTRMYDIYKKSIYIFMNFKLKGKGVFLSFFNNTDIINIFDDFN